MAIMACCFFLPNLAHGIICQAEQLGGLGRRFQPVYCILFSAKMCDAGMKVQGVYSVVHCRDSVGEVEGVLKNTC